jgi:hypothetical protein
MLRQCARPGCSAPATTTLSYDYAGRTVWLDPLHQDDHPARHDLCGRHADRLSVPNGWRLEDRRGAQHHSRQHGAGELIVAGGALAGSVDPHLP